MATSGERKFKDALRAVFDDGRRAIVKSLDYSEREEWRQIFRDHPIGAAPSSAYIKKALGPFGWLIGERAAGSALEAASEYIQDDALADAASTAGAWLLDISIPGLVFITTPVKLLLLLYRANRLKAIFSEEWGL